MKPSKKVWRSAALLIVLLAAAVFLLHFGYDRFQKAVYPIKYSQIVENNAKEYGLEPALIYSVIRAESNFNPNAKSRAGAVGLMQLMPKTYLWLQGKEGGSAAEEELLQPETNIRYGCMFLSLLQEKYPARRTALCAYNAGTGTVDGWLSDRRYSSDGKNLNKIPYPETQNYADAVERNYIHYKKLYRL